VLFPQVPDHHLDFQLRSSQHPQLVFSAHQAIHLVELPKFRLTAEELADPLDVWCYFLIHGAELDTDNLPAALRTPTVRRGMEVLRMLTQDEQERERYHARLKAQRDQRCFLKDAREEGREEGEILGRIHVCQRLLKLPVTPADELAALSLPELRARAEDLEQQLGLPKP
jgi:predicted transposase/invertase (TIGR01784 family)